MKVRILISYKGNSFFGWQKQKNESPTIQEEIEKALYTIFQRSVPVIGSGRTDAKVHALEQTAHFEVPISDIEEIKKFNISKSLNHLLPSDIRILSAFCMPESFHARFSSIGKSYVFFILNLQNPSVFFRDFTWQTHHKHMNLEKLNKMAQEITGTKDFKSFQSRGSDALGTVRTIYKAHWKKINPHLYRFEIVGSGFLKQMVRNLVGTQAGLLEEKSPELSIQKILSLKNRNKSAFPPAPGEGLYLKKVFYGRDLDRQSLKI